MWAYPTSKNPRKLYNIWCILDISCVCICVTYMKWWCYSRRSTCWRTSWPSSGCTLCSFSLEALLTNAITLSSSIVAALQYICISNAVGATVDRIYVSLRFTQHMIVYAYMNICVYIYMYPRSIHGIISDMSTRILHMEYIHRIHIWQNTSVGILARALRNVCNLGSSS